MILSLFLPVQVMPGQCIYDLTLLCESVIIILGKPQNSCMVKLPYLHVIFGLILSSILSADQLRKLLIMRNNNRCNKKYL